MTLFRSIYERTKQLEYGVLAVTIFSLHSLAIELIVPIVHTDTLAHIISVSYS